MTTQAATQAVARRTPAPGSVPSLLQAESIRAKFEQAVGAHAGSFMATLSATYYNNDLLHNVEPMSVIVAALQAAAYNLSVDPNIGQSHIIPYGKVARLQLGWRGYVQLAFRTGQYLALNVTQVVEGEIVRMNRLSSLPVWAKEVAPDAKPAGFLAYLKLKNGFEHAEYMTLAQIKAHGERYSKSWGKASSAWTTHFDEMAAKTVLLRLLKRWGYLSLEIQEAMETETPPDEMTGEIEMTPEERKRALAALNGPDDEAGEATGTTTAPAPDNAALDREIVEAEAKK